MCPSISEGIYAIRVSQGDVHLGYRRGGAPGIVHHSLLQTLDGANTRVPHMTPEVLEPPFAAGRENNSGKASLPDGCSYTFRRHLGGTKFHLQLMQPFAQSSVSMKFFPNRAAP